MRADAIVFGIAGTLFGLIVGWVLGSQQAPRSARAGPAAQAPPAPAAGRVRAAAAGAVDPSASQALEGVAAQNPKIAQPRVQLGNMYFDAEQYPRRSRGTSRRSRSTRPTPTSPPISAWPTTTRTSPIARSRSSSSRWRSIRSTSRRCSTSASSARSASRISPAPRKAWQQVVDLAPNSPKARPRRRRSTASRARIRTGRPGK